MTQKQSVLSVSLYHHCNHLTTFFFVSQKWGPHYTRISTSASLVQNILLAACLTSLGDVDQAQQVHQFEEHDDQAHDADRLQPLRLPPHAHFSLVFCFFLHGPAFPLHLYIILICLTLNPTFAVILFFSLAISKSFAHRVSSPVVSFFFLFSSSLRPF